MRFVRGVGVVWFVVGSFLSGQQTLPDADARLVTEVVKRAADAETFTAFCTSKAPRSGAQFDAAFDAWQQRNSWAALKAGAAAHQVEDGEYDKLKAGVMQDLQAHSFKSTFACMTLPRLFTAREHDPSVEHGKDLARIAASASAAARPAESKPVEGGGAPVAARAAASGTPELASTPAASAPVMTPPAASAPVMTAAVAAGGSGSFGDVDFTPPLGWKAGQSTPDTVLFSRPGKAGIGYLILFNSSAMSGSMKQSFNAAVRSLFPGTGLELKYLHDDAKTATGFPALVIRDSGTLRNGGRTAAIDAVGVAGPGNRLYLAMLITVGSTSDYDGEKEFEAAVQSWRFRGLQTAAWDPLKPAAGSGGQSGLFFGTHLENQMNMFGGLSLLAIRQYVILLPNGQAYSGIPSDGRVLDMDFAAAFRKTPLRCGTYRIEGGSIQMKWLEKYGLVSEQTTPFETKNGGAFFYLGATLYKVKPVHDLHLSGRFTSSFAMVGESMGNSNNVSSSTYIAFSPDGGYQKSGFSSASFTGESAGGTSINRKGIEAGRYTVDGFTMTLMPNGRQPELYTIVFEDPQPSPGAVFINDSAFLNDAKRH